MEKIKKNELINIANNTNSEWKRNVINFIEMENIWKINGINWKILKLNLNF